MSMRRDGHDELRARLRQAAGEHQPDRARMLARIEGGMTGRERPATHPPVWGWTRIAGATAAVAGLLAAGGYAVASAVRDDAPAQQTVAVSPAPPASPDVTRRPSAAPDTENGPLWSDGSIDPHSNEFWAQSALTLKTREPLTSLTVRLRVAQTGGVSSTGAWRTLPENDFTLTVGERDGFLVYTWTLKAGRTVPAGEWVFAGQYNHRRGGRDAGDDRYSITATAAGGPYTVGGDFAPHPPNSGGS
ncbi:hypothetical protein [Streptomyces sp. NPDC049915]|uniref:hypothetical protein n=1 Tax=Streptomyces sp. NPDC049915 TaxID=3155510 RepID=UPI00343C8E7F